MKTVSMFLNLALALVTAGCADAVSEPQPAAVEKEVVSQDANRSTEQVEDHSFIIHRGCNLECWFSQIGDRNPDPTYYTPETIRQLKEWGFDHIRLCVGEEKLYDDKYNRKEANWKLIEDILQACQEQGMKVIFDLQECRFWNCNHTEIHSMFYSSAALRKLWADHLCVDLAKYPDNFLAYDIINEPASSTVSNALVSWNEIAADVIKAIRKKEPQRTIVVCGDDWANPGVPFSKLDLAADPYVIASVHFYQPNNLCFYREPWGKYAQYDGPIHYPGFILQAAEWNKWLREWKEKNPGGTLVTDFTNWTNDTYNYAKMYKALKECKDHADALGVGFMLGELGTTFYLDPVVRKAWYTDIVKICDELGIPYTNWGTKGSFGIYKWNGKGPEKNVFDTDLTSPDTELIEILTQTGSHSGLDVVYAD